MCNYSGNFKLINCNLKNRIKYIYFVSSLDSRHENRKLSKNLSISRKMLNAKMSKINGQSARVHVMRYEEEMMKT